ncbi:unnamed protein product [Psylliodes chrysocephalus]|uniref:Cytochrome P450 n=1 Tax=Psylliodes chrysocephalus TaxID=3402493 RepID=A0A9P0CJ04_9CUCU|nr:unnamed protein product [Psylliodes chrysocephala]
MIFLCLLSLLVLILITKFYWSRRHLYLAAAKFNGPRGLPLIGNALSFFCNSEDVQDRIKPIFEHIHHEPIRFWLGPYLLIVLQNPVHLEKIMSSQKFAYKHDLYTFLETFVGNGLISASGLKPKYKIHRRIIQPMFDLKFVINAFPIMQTHVDICMKKLSKYLGKDNFNIFTVIAPCSMDIMTEVILGQKLNIQNGENTELCKAMLKMLNIGFTRMVKIWLHPDFIYNWHSLKKEQDSILATIHNVVNEAIIDSWVRRKLTKTNSKFIPIIDTLSEFKQNNPDSINQEDFANHLITLLAASEDPFAIISSFTVVCFGMYPEYQNKAAQEIRTVIGEEYRNITVEDIYKLTYLDMCVKDVMRLFPIAPYILRKTLEDYHLDKWIIPRGAAIVVPIYFLHRDPEFWANPEHFHPDNFLPEVSQKRHPYAYLPFSAGPRGCIGKTLANIEIKLFLANFLLRFEVVADGKVPDMALQTDISMRPKFGYNCRLKERNWKTDAF